MTEALLAIAAVAALACPLHMLWHARHRSAAGGCWTPEASHGADTLHARREAVADELARRQSAERSTEQPFVRT